MCNVYMKSMPLHLTTEKKLKIPYTDFKMKINKYILQQWSNNENKKNY